MQGGSYRAVQVSSPGKLELVERIVTEPPPGKVRIRVEACGVCHSDAVTVERHPLLGRAKDIGSAAVMLCLVFTVLVWAVVLWP